jgi:iron complex transport system ATP-binding protein
VLLSSFISSKEGGVEVVKLRDVTFSYNGKKALRKISFSLREGDFVGVVGPNGSGKSTLLKIIDGILVPHEGEVLFKEKPVQKYDRKSLARKIAFVPQNFNLDFEFTVEEVVEMGRYSRKGRWEKFSPSSLMEKMGISDLKHRFFPELSGGERQKVILAQSLAQEPELLLLDEPASHLDVSYQLKLFDFLRELNKEGLTILCVIHDLNLALLYFDELIMLSEGEIVASGKSDKVLTPERIESTYGIRAYIHRHAGRTFLTFSPKLRGKRKEKIHLICGGGSGSFLMRELAERGFSVSLGVVNALDSDEVLGRELGLTMAVEAPFSSITEEAFKHNLELIEQSELVILTRVPFGPGNLKNVEAAVEALKKGKKLWVVGKDLKERDFTGKATEMLTSVEGVVFFESEKEVVKELEKGV